MEALFASCSEEFQNTRSSQAQGTSAVESLDAKLKNLDDSSGQQLFIFSQKISALESRPMGAQPASAGGNPSPAGSPPAFAGAAAPGVGSSPSWTADDWARWRNGT
eukprot:5088673-Alexandrium_andersonii.AAC.1